MNIDTNDHFYRSSDGLRLYCRIYPAGGPGAVPVLCLPGLTRNSRDFAALAAHLQAQREVLAPDLRGRGRSAVGSRCLSLPIAELRADVWSLLESRAVDRVVVVGTSLGALMGMVMAATSPTGSRGSSSMMRVRRSIRRACAASPDTRASCRPSRHGTKRPRRRRASMGSALPGLTDEDWLDYARCGYRENADGVPVPDVDPRISEALKNTGTAAPDLWPLFSQIKSVPLLVIRGVLSDILSAGTLARMAHEKPDLMQVEVPNRGHTPLLNEPACLEAIDSFLGRSRGRRDAWKLRRSASAGQSCRDHGSCQRHRQAGRPHICPAGAKVVIADLDAEQARATAAEIDREGAGRLPWRWMSPAKRRSMPPWPR